MEALEITSHLTVADWRAYQAAWAARLQKHSRSRRSLLSVVLIAFVLAVLLVMYATRAGQTVPFAAVVIGASAAVLGIMLNMRRLRGAAQPDEDGVVLGLNELRLDTQGMHLRKAHSDIVHRWAVFRDLTITSEHLFVWVDTVAALIVPIRDLPAGVTPEDAAQRIRDFAAQRDESSHIEANAAARDSPPAGAVPSQEKRRIPAAILRALTLRASYPATLDLSDAALLRLWLVSALMLFTLDSLNAGTHPQFDSYGLVVIGWYGIILVSVAAMWARLSEPRVSWRDGITLASAFAPLAIVLCYAGLRYLPESASLGVLVLIALYATFYAHAGLRSLTARAQPRALFMGLLLLSLAAWFGQSHYLAPQFWYSEADAAGAADFEPTFAQRQQIESVLYAQTDLIDSAVDAMDRPDDLAVAGFFIGFAGVGEQRVFAGEIDLAQKAIGSKFGTSPRSMALVNDRRDLASYPLASASALRVALADVAAKMDLENDVLFLSLSSHGSADGLLAVSNPGVPLNDLTAEELADALEGSGIRWRVIVVSACYSGTFIEPLRNEDTIVITAAAADRTSFGCSDDRDLTYFGEAFYRDALPDSPDLRTAFQRTKTLIAEREKREAIEPSFPQAYFGAALERHLRLLNVAHSRGARAAQLR